MKKELERFARKAVIGKPEDRIDKLRKYLLQDSVTLLAHDNRIVLSPDEERMLKILEQAFALLIDNSESEARKILEKQHNVTSVHARTYISNAKQLFGLVESFDKVSARYIQIERFESIIKELKDDLTIEAKDKYKLVIECQSEINKLRRLFDDDVVDPKELVKQLMVPQPVLTTDPKALELPAEDAEVVE